MLFKKPAAIVHGLDSIGTIADYVPGKRVLLVTGQASARESGLEQKLTGLLKTEGRELRIFSGVQAEPHVDQAQDALAQARDLQADAVIAAGGGSVIDVGKAAAGLARETGAAAEYFQGRAIEKEGVFFAAVPTTAGTGSEATPNSVLSDPVAGLKKSIRAPHMMPDLALLDPGLTVGCPPGVTARAGLDALVQAIEALFSRQGNTFTQLLAGGAAERLFPALTRVFADPEDLKARGDMLYGAFQTGLAFANCRLGAVHGLAHPVGLFTQTPHGLVCARLMGPVLARNAAACPDLYQRLADLLRADPLEALRDLMLKLGVAPRFNTGLDDDRMQALLEYAASAGSMQANPVAFRPDELRAILREAGIEDR